MSLNTKVVTRSGSTSSLNTTGSVAKRSREDVSKHDELEIASLDELWSKMQAILSITSERIEAKIESCNAALGDRISKVEKQLTAVREEFSGKAIELEREMNTVRCEINNIAEATHRFNKNNELIISAVPYRSQENLRDMFCKIATSIGYDETNIPLVNLQRLSRVPITPGTTPPILCEFALRGNRNDFYHKYLYKRSLCLRNIGFESENRIFINENLTDDARRIRNEAVKQKKLGRLETVSTREGIIYVKVRGSEKTTAIHSIQQLTSLSNNPIL